jgi:hypothetical protein
MAHPSPRPETPPEAPTDNHDVPELPIVKAARGFSMSRAVRRAGTDDAAAKQRRRRRAAGPALVRRRERPVRAALNSYRNFEHPKPL